MIARRPHPVWALLPLLGACTAAPPPVPPLPATPQTRLESLRAREDQIRTLRARFRSVVRLPDAERAADGVLLVAKPDRFRLRLMLPLGLTVFDYLNVGERTWTALPLADSAQRDRVDAYAPFTRTDLAEAFLRGGYAFPGTCTPDAAPAGEVTVACRDNGAVRRTLVIGADGIVEETSYGDSGAPRLLIRYADYRAVGGTSLPYRITLTYPERQQSVAITIDSYEVNPVLADAVFAPAEP